MISARHGLTRAFVQELSHLNSSSAVQNFRRLALTSQAAKDVTKAPFEMSKPTHEVPRKIEEATKTAKKKAKPTAETSKRSSATSKTNLLPKNAPKAKDDVIQNPTKTLKAAADEPKKPTSSKTSAKATPSAAKIVSLPVKEESKSSKNSAKVTRSSEGMASVQYRCPHCSYLNESKVAIKQHIVSEHKTEPYTCPFCPEGFSNFVQLNKHIKAKHVGKSPLKEPFEIVSQKSKPANSESRKLRLTPKTSVEKVDKISSNKIVVNSQDTPIGISVDLHPIKFEPPNGSITTTEPPKSSLQHFPDQERSIELTVEKIIALEEIREKSFALNKLPENESTSINVMPEMKSSLTAFSEDKISSEKPQEVEIMSTSAKLKSDHFSGIKEWSDEELLERLQLLGSSRSILLRQMYPMKAFKFEEIELFRDVVEEELNSVLETATAKSVEENARKICSTYLLEMFPMKSFTISDFPNHPAPEEKRLRRERPSETEAQPVRSNFLENVKTFSLGYLKQFNLFRK